VSVAVDRDELGWSDGHRKPDHLIKKHGRSLLWALM
jgi:hypothetical protein